MLSATQTKCPLPPSQYDSLHDMVVSGDQSGMIEYWSSPVQEYGFSKAAKFQRKIDTHLYEFAKVTRVVLQFNITLQQCMYDIMWSIV